MASPEKPTIGHFHDSSMVGKRGTGKRGTKLQYWKTLEKAMYGKPNGVFHM